MGRREYRAGRRRKGGRCRTPQNASSDRGALQGCDRKANRHLKAEVSMRVVRLPSADLGRLLTRRLSELALISYAAFCLKKKPRGHVIENHGLMSATGEETVLPPNDAKERPHAKRKQPRTQLGRRAPNGIPFRSVVAIRLGHDLRTAIAKRRDGRFRGNAPPRVSCTTGLLRLLIR